jgi:hypothetical protein
VPGNRCSLSFACSEFASFPLFLDLLVFFCACAYFSQISLKQKVDQEFAALGFVYANAEMNLQSNENGETR